MLERVKIEQVVDVLQAIKAMRIPRPGLVKTNVRTFLMHFVYSIVGNKSNIPYCYFLLQAEYKSIYYTVQEYLAAFDDYANFK